MLLLKTQCGEKQAWLAAEPPIGEGPACGRRGRGCCSALLTRRPLPAGTNLSLLSHGWTQSCTGKICHLKAAFWDTAMEQCLQVTPCPVPPAAFKTPHVALGGLGRQCLTRHLRRHLPSALLCSAGFVLCKTAHENGLLQPTGVTLLQSSSPCPGAVVFFVAQNAPRAPG